MWERAWGPYNNYPNEHMGEPIYNSFYKKNKKKEGHFSKHGTFFFSFSTLAINLDLANGWIRRSKSTTWTKFIFYLFKNRVYHIQIT